MKLFITLLVVLFIFPIIISQLPIKQTATKHESSAEPNPVAFAANLSSGTGQLYESDKNILVYYSHPEEAYKPITMATNGVQKVSHSQTNIASLATLMEQYFDLHQINADILTVNVPKEIQTLGLQYKDSYSVVRPHVVQALSMKSYDLVIDFHRDAAKKSVTTTSYDNLSYARTAFVVGGKHEAYEGNYAYAEMLHHIMNEMVPGISRGIIKKNDAGSNGIYNQDLARNMILVELGGIDNTEEELVRTIAVVSRAIAKMLVNEQL